MRTPKRTMKGGVKTTKGFIRDLEHPSGKFSMTVKLKPAGSVLNGNPRPPVLSGGLVVFALPGGGSYISPCTLDQVTNEA